MVAVRNISELLPDEPVHPPLDEEIIFNNAVREYTLFAVLAIVLVAASHVLLARYRRRDISPPAPTRLRSPALPPADDEAMVDTIAMWVCTFSLSISLGAVLLLPLSIVSNEVLAIYRDSHYVRWINRSLIQGLWNMVFLFSNLSLFVALPFAYLFTEAEGFPGTKKGVRGRMLETVVVLLLLVVLVLGVAFILALLLGYCQHSTIRQTIDVWSSFYLPFLYSLISCLGVLFLLLCTPVGLGRLFSALKGLIRGGGGLVYPPSGGRCGGSLEDLLPLGGSPPAPATRGGGLLLKASILEDLHAATMEEQALARQLQGLYAAEEDLHNASSLRRHNARRQASHDPHMEVVPATSSTASTDVAVAAPGGLAGHRGGGGRRYVPREASSTNNSGGLSSFFTTSNAHPLSSSSLLSSCIPPSSFSSSSSPPQSPVSSYAPSRSVSLGCGLSFLSLLSHQSKSNGRSSSQCQLPSSSSEYLGYPAEASSEQQYLRYPAEGSSSERQYSGYPTEQHIRYAADNPPTDYPAQHSSLEAAYPKEHNPVCYDDNSSANCGGGGASSSSYYIVSRASRFLRPHRLPKPLRKSLPAGLSSDEAGVPSVIGGGVRGTNAASPQHRKELLRRWKIAYATMRHYQKVSEQGLFRRCLVYPLGVVVLLGITGVVVLLVVFNTLQLISGFKSLPLVTAVTSVTSDDLGAMLGKRAVLVWLLGPLGAVVEVLIILYLVAASLVGCYSLPLMRQMKPVRGDTPMVHLIGNCVLVLVLASALPLLATTLGLTNFDLLGDYGRVGWLGNFWIVLAYNLLFVSAAVWCLVQQLTTAVREEIYDRLGVLGDALLRHCRSPAPEGSPLARLARTALRRVVVATTRVDKRE